MTWSTHPKPEGRAVSVRQALRGFPAGEPGGHEPQVIAAWRLSYPGQALRKACPDVGSFQSYRFDPDAPSNTQIKSHLNWHWQVPRQLTTTEAAVLQGFPRSFEFTGTKADRKERIGNSVPPPLMKHIAKNLAQSPAMTPTRRRPSDSVSPTVISLFAGCGGSSLGYHMAGYRELLAVEWDANAAETFRLNFPAVPLYHGDICALTVAECMRLSGLKETGELDVLDGSPPCQGFSTAGHREIEDPRNSLFKQYCRLLLGLKPKALVMENVTGLVKGHMKRVYLDILAEIRACGYEPRGQVLNAAHYGVPQNRERVIIVGVRKDLWRPEYGG